MTCATRFAAPATFLLAMVLSVGCEEPSKNKFDASQTPPAETMASKPEDKPEESAPKSFGELLAEVKGMGQVMVRAAQAKNLINANAEMRDIADPLVGLEKAAAASTMSDEDKAKVKAAIEKAFDTRQTMLLAVSSGDDSVDYDALASQLEEVMAELDSVSAE